MANFYDTFTNPYPAVSGIPPALPTRAPAGVELPTEDILAQLKFLFDTQTNWPSSPEFSTPANVVREGASALAAAPASGLTAISDANKALWDWFFMPEGEYNAPPPASPDTVRPNFNYTSPPGTVPATGPTEFELWDEAPMPEMAAPPGVDFSAADEWMRRAAPTPGDPAEAARAEKLNWLAGIGQGLGSVNAGRDGIAAMLAAMAGGGATGLARGQQIKTEMLDEDADEQQAYAGSMAGFEGEKARIEAATAANTAEIKYRNDVATQLAGQGKVVSSDNGKLIVQTGGNIKVIPYGQQTEQLKQLQLLSTALGADNPTMMNAKYDFMFSQQTPVEGIQAEIVSDIIRQGQGPAVFQNLYNQMLEVATEQAIDAGAIGGKEQLEYVERNLPGLILGETMAAQNFDWWELAASMGNPGAQRLLFYSKNPPAEITE